MFTFSPGQSGARLEVTALFTRENEVAPSTGKLGARRRALVLTL